MMSMGGGDDEKGKERYVDEISEDDSVFQGTRVYP